MNTYLYFTSFMYSTVIFHAYSARETFAHHMFTILYGLSILRHAKRNQYAGKEVVNALHFMISKAIVLYQTYRLMNSCAPAIDVVIAWAYISLVGYMYYGKGLYWKLQYDRNDFMEHAFMQLVGTVGTHHWLNSIR